eukprot:763100-Hanusia_phi.AAC.9
MSNTIRRPVLVLDLDETLLHSGAYGVLPRPYLRDFILNLRRRFVIIVFTAGTHAYAQHCLRVLSLTEHVTAVFSREHMRRARAGQGMCKRISPFLCKRCVERTYVVDDKANSVWDDSEIPRERIIAIKPFLAMPSDFLDRELSRIESVLEEKEGVCAGCLSDIEKNVVFSTGVGNSGKSR